MTNDHAKLPTVGDMLQMIFEKWYNDNIPRHAAVLAFYALFALAPILLLSIEAMKLIYQQEDAEAQVLAQVSSFTQNPETTILVQTLLNNVLPSSAAWWVTASFLIALLYGASSFFVELKIVLNQIWGVPLAQDVGLGQVIIERLQAVLMVLIGSLLIICGLFVASWFTNGMEWLALSLNWGTGYATWGYLILVFMLFTILFALIYKFVPNVTIAWQDVWIGAAATALLISITRLLISWYFGYSYTSTMFGAASAIVIILLWVYYSAQIFFLGAEFTYVYCQLYGTAWAQGQQDNELFKHDQATSLDTIHSSSPIAQNGTGEREPQERSVTYTIDELPPRQRSVPIEFEVENVDPAMVEPSQPIGMRQSASNLRIRLSSLYKRAKSPLRTFESSLEKFRPDSPRTDSLRTDSPTTDSPTTNQPRTDSPTTDQPRTDSPTTDSPTTNQPTTDQPTTDSPTTDSPRTDSPTTDQLPTDQPTTIPDVRNRLTQVQNSISAARTNVKQTLSLPMRLIRPIRDIIVAVGVIGAISLAALVGIPFWRKRGRQLDSVDEDKS
ncbi:MAG: YhjD/YihY/BrkB family envelope integrity protein [Chloroflexota bacterium]